MTLRLISSSFDEGGDIPRQYTCDGPNVSPPLRWTDPPTGTVSFALIADDPDAPRGTWVHWVLWGIPGPARELPQDAGRVAHRPDGSRQGKNDFDTLGYGGPCPPPGPAHRYFFRLYALDARLDLPAGARRAELDAAMVGHVLAETALAGKYGR